MIHDVSFYIPEKEMTAIVGPSGCGKTTLTRLMARFWDVGSGCVSIGGIDVRKIHPEQLYSYFSIVFQNVFLFHDTIENNIRFGNPAATHEEVVAAAKKACCHDFIQSLPDGYATMVEENGGNLSGGEKQRISIARAILKDAPIILLDEATSSVDPENEWMLQQAIQELTAGKTVVMIAHKIKTIMNAGQIIVMDNGRVHGIGTHEALLQSDEIYRTFGMQEEQHLNGKFERRTSNHEQQIAGKRFNYYWYLHSFIHSCHLRGECGKCYSADFYVLSRYFFFAGRSIFHYAGNEGTEIWGCYHLGRDCWLALFGAWHGINTSVFVVASIIAQFILSKGGYKSMKAAIGSYVLISIFSIGGYAQLFLFTDQYLEEAARRGLSDAFVSGLESYSTIGFLLIMIVATAICALLGCMFAKAVLKKHLSKAGVL